MTKNRFVNNVVELTNGPEKLTITLKIDKSFNNLFVTSSDNKICIV